MRFQIAGGGGSSASFANTAGPGHGGRGELGGAAGAVLDEHPHRLDQIGPHIGSLALAVLNQGVGDAGQFAPSG